MHWLFLSLCAGWAGALSLALQRVDAAPLLAMAALSGLGLVANWALARWAPQHDPLLLPIAVFLTSLGLLSISRTAPNFLLRQTLWLLIAFSAMLVLAQWRGFLPWSRRLRVLWLVSAIALVAATLLFGVNPAGSGARLWLSVGGLFIQPSELLRLFALLFLAASLAKVHSPSVEVSQTVLLISSALLLLVGQQDLGAASLLALTCAAVAYFASGSAVLPLATLSLLVAGGIVGALASDRLAQRVTSWLNPWADPQGSSFQIVQSLIAIANGGVFGQGLGQGRPSYVPAVHTDFPFVTIAEELGLIGVVSVLGAFGVLVLRAWRIAAHSTEPHAFLLAAGVGAALIIQTAVILGGNLGVLPLTGVTLPFVSYGGSSLLASYAMIGILLNLSQTSRAERPVIVHQARLRCAAKAAALMLVGLGAASAYWSVIQRDLLIARTDNPRRVEAELAVFRGAIYDRSGALLAYSTCAGALQPLTPCSATPPLKPARYERRYPAVAAAPVVGYYSQRYGVGGIEAYADEHLRGTRSPLDVLLHRPQIGLPLTTTLDLARQRFLAQVLEGQLGAAVVLDWRTGAVLALVSAPVFDPNTLDDTWELLRDDTRAPLLNRATQGLYQPGALLQWLLDLQRQRGNPATDFASQVRSLSLDRPVRFELPNAATPLPTTVTYSETIGQGQLRVSPLRVAVSTAELVAGQPVTPTLLAPTAPAQPAQAKLHPEPFVGRAQIADNRHVLWHVEVDQVTITVLAIEQDASARTEERP
ncbi:MAG: FtsW/RodA/SpoVE family cell cycle protein [Anaerolineae bacterium]|nr:FtsW/RodA/SpoVE family cell cycle protein [Thermoflexales bacterium]MDW8395329.1 FtsW/RodA/SpoVE family cell cycle protein [Anaerolineae bacterium]